MEGSSNNDQDFLEQFIDSNIHLYPLDEHFLTENQEETVTTHLCHHCSKTFSTASNLYRHVKEKHFQNKLRCQNCGKTYTRKTNLDNHQKNCNGGPSQKGPPQKKLRTDEEIIDYEMNNIPDEMADDWVWPLLGDELQQDGGQADDEFCSLNRNANIFKYNPNKHEKNDLLLTLRGKKKSVITNLKKHLNKQGGIKWHLSVKVRMVKTSVDAADQISEPHFRSFCYTTINQNDIEKNYDDAVAKIKESFLEYLREGSGWQLDEVLHLDLGIVTYKPLKGASYLPLPKRIRNKKAVLNVQNSDKKCFLWSILAGLHPVPHGCHPHRVAHYQSYEQEINMTGISYPVELKQICKFEKQNHLSVNVFGFENNELLPLYITKQKQEKHVNLLLFSKGEVRHYCLIKDLDKLLFSMSNHHGRMYHCVYCLHGFVRQELLDKHEPICSKHGPQGIRLPDEDHNILSFKEVAKQLKVPFIIYADFESILVKCDSASLEDNKSGTRRTQEHRPCGFGYTVVSTLEQYNTPPVIYRGEDCVDRFLESLLKEEERILEIINHEVPMIITDQQEREFQRAVDCHICGEVLGADRVRDHDHMTGLFRGAAHSDCNLNYKFTGRIPVVFHNLRNYDSHLIMQGLGKLKKEKIDCIPNNTEKYISFSINNLVFIDSLQFLNSSLERLVENLSKEGMDKFQILRKYIDSDKVPLLLRKGVYPYEYVDSFERFKEPSLPSIEHFHSSLTGSTVSESDFDHAMRVFQTFHCRTLGDYHDLYLKSDILLLADVFENFRKICLSYYQLDPAHFYTSPGLAWTSCLKMTGVELELFTDPDMYLFIESGLRGGISMITHRYAKANNPYIPNYNKEEESNYIMYLDMNNLYGTAMCEPLPVNNFGWLTPEEIEELDFTTVPVDGEEGYILEVDLEYPQHLHKNHNDYPLAAEKLKVPHEWLSSYCVNILDELQMNYTSTQKLVPNLKDKEHYILHYRNLQQYLSLGMKLKKIHRVLTFDQSPWLRTYIEFNTEKRKNAANDFEKDFFKLMNNSVFGKTMENLRRRVQVKLVNTEKDLLKWVASPLFDYFRIFNEDLVGLNLKKRTLYLNRPIYVGFTILELSKTFMYDFHYNVMKRKYEERATLLFTDTDSLCYDVRTEDIYQDMYQDLNLYDTSDYPRDHPLYSTVNKKVLGKMKDETQGIAIEEFVGLRPKMYSLLYHKDGREVEKKTAKGVAKIVTKRDIRHSHYKECLFSRKRTIANMWQLRSNKHKIYTVNINKIGLSSYDDKRYLLKDGVTSLAYGHVNLEFSQSDLELVDALVSLS